MSQLSFYTENSQPQESQSQHPFGLDGTTLPSSLLSKNDDDTSTSSSSSESDTAIINTADNTNNNNNDADEDADTVILRIESLVQLLLVDQLDNLELFHLVSSQGVTKRFTLVQCRNLTSVLLVLSFCHALLLSNKKTTTCREVYYHYVTHFRSQAECDAAIQDATLVLNVPRHALGLKASPKGWFVGDVQFVQPVQQQSTTATDAPTTDTTTQVLLDARHLQSSIGSEWLTRTTTVQMQTHGATCILVIEKEGVYNRLCEDKFYETYPCILVTGKGFPDLATRAFVCALHKSLNLPVFGLADCDPYGVMVLHCYEHSQRGGRDGGERYSVPIQWLGLRPLQLVEIKDMLPDGVFMELTDNDKKRLDGLLNNHRWTQFGEDERRVEELQAMRDFGYKVELEALNWLGMDYCAEWIASILEHQAQVCNTDDNGSVEHMPHFDII
jgi:meiotic recombination protein SPO11